MKSDMPSRQRLGRRVVVAPEESLEPGESVARRPLAGRPGELRQAPARPFGAVAAVGRVGRGDLVRAARGAGVSLVEEAIALLEPELAGLEPVGDLFGEPTGFRVVARRLAQEPAPQGEPAAVTHGHEELPVVAIRPRLRKEGLALARGGRPFPGVDQELQPVGPRHARQVFAARPSRQADSLLEQLPAAPLAPRVVERRREVDRNARP